MLWYGRLGIRRSDEVRSVLRMSSALIPNNGANFHKHLMLATEAILLDHAVIVRRVPVELDADC